MSIVTLKHKTLSSKNISGGNSGIFSINGTYRNQGYVGRNSFFRPACCCVEDSTAIKPSVISTKGMIDTKYRWTKRGFPYTSVKVVNNNGNQQGDYINKLKKCTLTEADSQMQKIKIICWDSGKFEKTIKYSDQEITGSITYEEYIDKLHKKCATLYDEKLVVPTKNTPFACGAK